MLGLHYKLPSTLLLRRVWFRCAVIDHPALWGVGHTQQPDLNKECILVLNLDVGIGAWCIPTSCHPVLFVLRSCLFCLRLCTLAHTCMTTQDSDLNNPLRRNLKAA